MISLFINNFLIYKYEVTYNIQFQFNDTSHKGW